MVLLKQSFTYYCFVITGSIRSFERELLLREQNVIAGMIGELLLYELQLYKLFVPTSTDKSSSIVLTLNSLILA